jgi:hypothetical protein
MRQSRSFELTWGHERCVAVVGRHEHKKITLAFVAISAPAFGNAKQLNGPDPSPVISK